MHDMRDMRDMGDMGDMRDMRDICDMRDMRDVSDIQKGLDLWTRVTGIGERPKSPIEKRKRNLKFFSPIWRREREL